MSAVTRARDDDQPSWLGRAALLLALLACFAVLPRLFHRESSALSGKDAPELGLKFVANAPAETTEASLAAFRGHPVLLDFWATWCGPCRMEAPTVDRIAQRYKDQGLTVVGVNTSDEQGNAAPFARRNRLSFPIAYDEGQRAAAAYGVENLPTLVIINKEGKIAAVRTGVTSDAELDALVRREL